MALARPDVWNELIASVDAEVAVVEDFATSDILRFEHDSPSRISS
jgi:hypothetical protein